MPESSSPEIVSREVRARLINDPDVIMVIGHFSSTNAATVIREVYESDSFSAPIPLILVTVTNPNITLGQKAPHILRLPATDKKQAACIAELLRILRNKREAELGKEKESIKITLILDSDNETYSKYIARRLLFQEHDVEISDSIGIDLFSIGDSVKQCLEAMPDILVFIAGEELAKPFLVQLRDRCRNEKIELKPTLVCTEAVAGGNTFYEYAQRLFANQDEELLKIDRIFMTGPFYSEKQDGHGSKPSFKPHAGAARELAYKLVKATHKDRPTREDILQAIAEFTTDQPNLTLGKHVVQFDQNGDNQLGKIHVWKIGPNGVSHDEEYCVCNDL